MLTGGANNSGPALDAAAQAALSGTAADLREFLLNGQFTARALDTKAAAPAAPAGPPAAPAASAAPADTSAGAPQPERAAPPAAVGEDPIVLPATGPSGAAAVAVLAATAVLTGTGLIVLVRRRRKA